MNYRMLQKIMKLRKEYFNVPDLEKIFRQNRATLYVTLSRYVKEGWLRRIKAGIYQLSSSSANVERIANQMYYPSYLSFESALAKYGVLSQVPYTFTFATCKRTKNMTVRGNEVVFRQLKKELFFGYKLSGGLYTAQIEKALLDELYLVSRGKSSVNLAELDLKRISKSKTLRLARKFPEATQKLANMLFFPYHVRPRRII